MAPKRGHESGDDGMHRVAKKPKPSRPFTRSADGKSVWHGHDPILGTFKLKHLRKNGYINFSGTLPPVDLVKAVTDMVDPVHGHSDIHPVFARTRWIGLSEKGYKLLLPGLRMASCMLNEPSVVTFFNGLLNRPLEVIENDGHRQRLNVDCLHRFRPIGNDPPDFKTSLATVRTLIEMQRYLSWQFVALPNGINGVSTPSKNCSGFVKNQTYFSHNQISQEFLAVFLGAVDVTQFPKAATHHRGAALARTYFKFACVLLHEFTHALIGATYEQPVGSTRPWYEPFYCDQRISELGFAFEQAVFDGVPQPSCGGVLGNMVVCAPYGLQMVRFPGGLVLSSGKHAVIVSPLRAGAPGVDWAAISMADVSKFFTKEFWEKKAPQSNGAALNLEWKVGARKKTVFEFLPYESTAFPPHYTPEPKMPSRAQLVAAGFPSIRIHAYDTSSDEEDAVGS